MAIPREVGMFVNMNLLDPVETTRQPLTKAYLQGALHDATVRKVTYRIGASDLSYAKFLKNGIIALGYRAWIYKEGKDRNYYIVEFARSLLDRFKLKSTQDKIDYIRGYFDTDGAVARSKKVRYYLYFSQKNKKDLSNVRNYLQQLGISCGVIHNPSKKMDDKYFRFFINAKSYSRFAELIGSWHPIKSKYVRVKI